MVSGHRCMAMHGMDHSNHYTAVAGSLRYPTKLAPRRLQVQPNGLANCGIDTRTSDVNQKVVKRKKIGAKQTLHNLFFSHLFVIRPLQGLVA